MADGTKGSKKGGKRVRHDQPIGTKGTISELPPRSHASAVTEVIQSIVDAKPDWIELDPAGRQTNSVQSMVSAAAKKMKIEVEVAVRGDQVFARAL